MQKLIFLLIATLILPSIALSNPLVGSWGWSKTNDTLVITFLDDSNFVLADNDQADGDGQPGIEVGTYTWNPSTGAFSATVTLDTNGEWGFSHSQNIENATVTGDTLAFTIVGEDVFELPRIASTSTSKKSVNITPIISLLLDDDPNENLPLIEGEWNINGLASGPGAPWWERGNMIVGPDGSFTASVTDNDGVSENPSGKLNISNTRILSSSGSPNFGGSLDLLNRVMVWTNTWTTGSPGTTELNVLTRQGESYSQSDLTGTWELNSLASGSGAPWWIRGAVTISADGSFSGLLEEYESDPDSASGIRNPGPGRRPWYRRRGHVPGVAQARQSGSTTKERVQYPYRVSARLRLLQY